MSKQVFISYCHKDKRYKDRFITHSTGYVFQGMLKVWDDTHIKTGSNWLSDILEAIASADIAVLLVSADFLASKFVYEEEIPRLLKRRVQDGMQLLPVILSECAWQDHEWLSSTQVKLAGGKPLDSVNRAAREKTWKELVVEIRKWIDTARPPRFTDITTSPPQVDLLAMPIIDNVIFGREIELTLLDSVWAEQYTNVISIIAWAGVGKTSLINNWLLQHMQPRNWRGATRVFAWSFYSHGALESKHRSADDFFFEALRWFGDDHPETGSPDEKAIRLAKLIKEKRTILVLDGIEPLQYPPGPQEGRVKDRGLYRLLRELAIENRGLCIITSRLRVEDLKNFSPPQHVCLFLEHLSPEAGAELFEHAGIIAPKAELIAASKEYDGHALALNLLSSYVNTVLDGDITRRSQIRKLIFDQDTQGRHARQVMASYELWLNSTEEGRQQLGILYLLGLFDRPTEKAAISHLLNPIIPGLPVNSENMTLEEIAFAVTNLRRLRLVDPKNISKQATVDCHPLVREHFGQRFREICENGTIEAHKRLFDYYQKVPDNTHPNTIEELEPLFVAIYHACEAGLHQKAIYLLWERILRGSKFYLNSTLGAYGAFLSVLSYFFTIHWNEVSPNLAKDQKIWVIGEAGNALRALGRANESIQPLESSMNQYLLNGHWQHTALASTNLASSFFVLGEFDKAFECGKKILGSVESGASRWLKCSGLCIMARSCYLNGKKQEAYEMFKEAEAEYIKLQSSSKYLHSLNGYWYCELLMEKGQYAEVKKRATNGINLSHRHESTLAIGLYSLLLAEVAYRSKTSNRFKNKFCSLDLLNKGIDILVRSGQFDDLPIGYIKRAEVSISNGDLESAWHDLNEVFEIADRGSMKLYLVDYYILGCKACIREFGMGLTQKNGLKEKALFYLGEANRIITDTKYHRKNSEIVTLMRQVS